MYISRLAIHSVSEWVVRVGAATALKATAEHEQMAWHVVFLQFAWSAWSHRTHWSSKWWDLTLPAATRFYPGSTQHSRILCYCVSVVWKVLTSFFFGSKLDEWRIANELKMPSHNVDFLYAQCMYILYLPWTTVIKTLTKTLTTHSITMFFYSVAPER